MIGASTPVYLKQNAVLEPLVNRWYAWTYLIPPVPLALFVANHHTRIMQSFVATPQLHVDALRKPGMAGGPFINYPSDRSAEVQALLEQTQKEQHDLLELAGAVKALNELLANEAGSSLEPLYAAIPEPLAGYVELVYDTSHRPSFRLLESLLYTSRFYKRQNQTVALSLASDDARSFVLSTPRLARPDVAWLDLPFESPLLDELARARAKPKPLGFFQDALRLDGTALDTWFTDAAPASRRCAAEPGVRVRYLGHACLLVEFAGTSILFDPIVPYKHGSGMDRFGYDDLPELIDYVVITHNHQDHAVLETLLQLRHRIGKLIVPTSSGGSIADPSLKLVFRQLGFPSVHNLDELETLELEHGALTALPFLGEHGDLDVRTKAAHLLRLGGQTILCAADSNNVDPRLYSRLAALVGRVDALFIGMECQGAPMSWLYGPLLSKPISRKHDQSRRLDGSNAAKALDIVDKLRPGRVYVYAMGAEPWLGFISSIDYDDDSLPIRESDRLVQECQQRGLVAERLFGARDIRLVD